MARSSSYLPGRWCRLWWSSRLLPGCKDLDDNHASATAGARRALVIWFARSGVIDRCDDVQELARKRKAGLSGRACEKAVVPDAVEAARQDMEQEAADKLIDGERHDLLPIGAVATVVFVAEGNAGFVRGDQSAVRDCDPMGVA